MKWLFWISVALLAYTYAGYPLLLWVWARLRAKKARRGISQPAAGISLPSVSVVIAVYNEAATLAEKLRNLSEMDYPAGKLEIVIASDGSNDLTNQILEEAVQRAETAGTTEPRLRACISSARQGKAAALNRALEMAQGKIVLFTDARQQIERGALKQLLADFSDPAVGCVSGELHLRDGSAPPHGKGLSLYWNLEKTVRKLEAEIESTVGATGACYAVPRNLVPVLPEGTILDDVYIPMEVVRQGKRVIFEPQARAWDELSPLRRHEFRRKVRTLAGNYQLLRLSPWILSWKNPIVFQFISHKLLRLTGPFLLFAVFLSSLLLPGPIYRAALALNLGFYLLAAIALLQKPAQREQGTGSARLPIAVRSWHAEEPLRSPPRTANHKLGSQTVRYFSRAANAAFAFVLLNTAALVAFGYWFGRKRELWVK